MTIMQDVAIRYIQGFSENKLHSALDYLRYLHAQGEEHELDAFDYELAKQADEAIDTETIPFDEVLRKAGLTYADIQD